MNATTGASQSQAQQVPQPAALSHAFASVLIYPDPPPIDAARVVDFMGARWKAIGNDVDVLNLRPTQDHDEGAPLFDIATISLEGDPVAAKAVLEAIRRKAGVAATVIVLVRGNQLQDLDDVTHLFDDFCVTPFHPAELEARIRTCLRRGATIAQPHVDTIEALLSSNETLLTYEDLVLNLETYQAQVDSRSLDLTYMEYELLRFLVESPGKVFSREILLRQVWGYEYFGGARTVDVHIRRLRAKLGEEHARLIQTVRSVGYRFGESRWSVD